MSKYISIVICICLLSACHPSPETIRRVNELTYIKKDKVLTCPEEDSSHCAIDTPLEPLYNKAIIDKKDRITLLEKGDDSLLIRLHMIKSAQTSK